MSEPKITLSAVDMTRAAFASVQAGLKGVQTSAVSVTGALGALGVAGAALTFAASIKGAIDAADQMNKLAQRTGIATEQLSQLQFAAKLSDVSTESLTAGIKKLNLSIAEGLGGDKAKIEMFRNLGITLTDASGKAKSADKVLMEMAGTFSTAKDGATKTAYAVGLMGKAGDEMIPLLNGGTQALGEMMEKAGKLGLTISTDFARQAEEFNDNLTIVKTSSDKLTIALAGDLVSGLGRTVKAMADAGVAGGKFAAILAGIKTLLTGDDQHKNNVKLVEDTEKLWNLQEGLTKLYAAGYTKDTLAVKSQQKQIDEVNARLRTTLAYRKDLAAQDAKAAVAESSKPKQTGTLKALTGGATASASEYEALVKRIKERIALSDAELKAGRELTDQEKFEAKVIEDMAGAKTKLTASQQVVIQGLIAESAKLFAANDARAKHLKQVQASMEFYAQVQDELKASISADSQERDRLTMAIYAEGRALVETGELMNLEGRLIAATDRERQIAMEHLRIEIKLRNDLRALKQNTAFNASQRATEEAALKANAELAKQQVVQRANMDEFQRAWQSVDQTAHEVFVNIFEGGSNVFKRLAQTLKATLLDMLYQMTVRKWILNIGASISGSAAMAGGAPTNAVSSAGTSMIGNAMGSMFGAGGLSGSLMAGAGWMTGATTFGGSLAAAGSLMGTGTAAGMMSGLGMAAGALGPIGLGIMALSALSALAKRGETRSGGQYSGATFLQGPSGGEIGGDATRQAITGTISSINATLKALGSTATLGNLQSGLESSSAGKGFAYAGGTLSTGATFGQGFDGMGYMNRRGSMSGEQASAAFAEELKQATLQALQAADVPGQLGDYLRQLGDIDALSGGALDEALGRINKALTEKQNLEARLFDATATDLEKLNKARDDERAAIDETNKSLLEQVYVAEDMKSAMQGFESLASQMTGSITEAGNAAKQMAADFAQLAGQIAMDGMSGAIATWQQKVNDATSALIQGYSRDAGILEASVDQFSALAATLREARLAIDLGPNSALTLRERSAAARGALYSATPENLPAASGQYLDVIKGSFGSRTAYLAETDRVRALLKAQEDQASAKGSVAQQQLDALRGLLSPLVDINQGVKTVAQLVAALGEARFGLALSQLNQSTYSMTQEQAGPLYDELYNSLPSYDVGSDYVPRTGPAIIHRGETILSNGTSSEIVVELRAMRERLDAIEANTQAGALHTAKVANNTREAIDRGVPALNNPTGEALSTVAA